jgi:phosphatidylglycerophosphatase C
MKQGLALFDFDGTITNKDTLFAFMAFHRGRSQMLLDMISLSPWLIGLKVKLFSAHTVKERMLKVCIGGLSLEAFNERCTFFCEKILPRYIRSSALERIAFHQGRGDQIFIVSASPENWIKPWADQYRIEVISTKLVARNGVITGQIEGLNCNGVQKAVRVKEAVDLKNYTDIFAYGDTSGDTELLALATHRFYRKLH